MTYREEAPEVTSARREAREDAMTEHEAATVACDAPNGTLLDGSPVPTRSTFTVPAENVDALQERIAKLNKRVALLQKRGYKGVEPVVIEVGPAYPVPQKCTKCHEGKLFGATCEKCSGTGRLPDRIYHEVTLVSPKAPKVDGWEFVAALTHVDGVGSVLRVVPGAEVAEGELARFREASSENCDHCHAKRRRTDTFIVRKVVAA